MAEIVRVCYTPDRSNSCVSAERETMELRGRPRLYTDKMFCSVTTLLPQEDYQRLRREAEVAGYKSFAAFVRDRLLDPRWANDPETTL